jgi:DNA-binding NtrC family response regulator
MASILLLEPDNIMREMYEEILESAGFNIIICDNPQKCLKFVLEKKPSVIVTSTNKLEATWLIERVRKEKNPGISTIPILVIMEDVAGNISEYIKAGASKCLPKFPESGERLVAELRKIINIPRVGFN